VPERKKKIILGSAVCLLLLLFGVYSVRQHFAKPPVTAPSSEYTIGVMDLKKAMNEHPRYADLTKLREQRNALAAAAEVKTAFSFANPLPEVPVKPFDDGAEQKANQQKAQKLLEYERNLQAKEQELRSSLESQRRADKKAVSESYLNAIFNGTLKLDNAASLRLTDAQQKEIQDAINDLKRQRGAKVRAIDWQYEKQIADQIDFLRQQYAVQLQMAVVQDGQKFSAEAAAKQTEAQLRNAAAMQRGMENTADGFAAGEKNRAALEAKDREINALEDLIIKEIAGKAAKAAILHHLEYIFANPFVNVSALDVTDEVIEELKASKN